MPIYEYTCQKCKAHIEIMQKVTDKPLARHGKCGGKLEKEWSKTGFQFKGSGWYVTDYAGKKSDAKDATDAKETKEKKSDAASDKTADAKPATDTKATTDSKAAKPKATSSATGKATGGD